MIIVLGQSQAFPESFAAWLRTRGHTVDICPDEPNSFIVDGDGPHDSVEALFDDYSDGEYFHRDESEW